MKYKRDPLTTQYRGFVKRSQQLSAKETLTQGLSLLKDIEETGKFLVNPEQRSILYSFARSIGSTLFDISGRFPMSRVASPLDLAWEIEPSDVTLVQLQAYILMHCHRTLFKFREFDSRGLLQECFSTQTLAPYRDALPIATSKTERISKTIVYLLQKQLSDERPILLEFLTVLRDREPLASGLGEEVEILLCAIGQVLSETSEESWEAPCSTFHLTFVNREAERNRIWSLLLPDFYVQLLAPSGYGKTYLLRQLQQEIGLWLPVWIDFASSSHQPLRTNRYLFLQAFYQQVFGTTLCAPSSGGDEKVAIAEIGNKLASIDQEILLFLDHVESADEALLTWIGEAFLVKLATEWVPVRVVAASQVVIKPWQRLTGKRSFQLLHLPPLDEPEVLEQIINDVVEHFGAEPARQRKAQPQAWQDDLNIITSGLLQISGGHPQRIAYLLRYVAEQDGFVTPAYLTDHSAELSQKCLAKV